MRYSLRFHRATRQAAATPSPNVHDCNGWSKLEHEEEDWRQPRQQRRNALAIRLTIPCVYNTAPRFPEAEERARRSPSSIHTPLVLRAAPRTAKVAGCIKLPR